MLATAPTTKISRSWSVDVRKIGVTVLLMLLVAGLAAVGIDDVHAHRALPEDTVYARRYVDGMVRLDPKAMWAAFSVDAQQARGGDADAYEAFLRLGTHAPVGPPNPYHLAAQVPLDDGRMLLYYVVELRGTPKGDRLLVPLVVDATGHVEDAGNDGLSFLPPRRTN